MVKFISKILTKKECTNTLQVLGNLLKPGAIMLFIDNSEGNVSLFVEDILKETGLKTILGPSHETYVKFAKSDLKTYGFPAQSSTKISVIGWMKTNISIEYGSLSKSYSSLSVQSENEFDSNSLSVRSENEFVSNSSSVQSENECVSNSLSVQCENECVSNSSSVQSPKECVSNSSSVQKKNEFNNISNRSYIGDCNNDINKISNTFCDKYTQTDVNGLFEDKLNQTLVSNEIGQFLTLTEAVANLLEMVKKVRTQNNSHANCCCHYH
ncbi:uncharacterized protein CDAR_388291 [Caerostris darwini]|uniref:Uncharacterized protein n=1 Tax=Caerostris darwini TaxID=1538125 RepID=A0AAV4VF70_9ARAC|nr:uncharacterized protein CDAR_388291 [Caerostris darwini]